MEGVRVSRVDPVQEFYRRLFKKLVSDLHEALARTPPHISSYRHVERACRLALAGYSVAVRGGLTPTVYLKEEGKP
jgi:hypothetical protein